MNTTKNIEINTIFNRAQGVKQPRYHGPRLFHWLALLFAGISILAWLNVENIVVWSLSNGLINEAATRSLPGILRYVFLIGWVLGAVYAHRIAVSGLLKVYSMKPVRTTIDGLGRALRPLFGLIVNVGRAVSHALIQPLLLGLAAAAHSLILGLKCLAIGILVPIDAAWRVAVSSSKFAMRVLTAIVIAIETILEYPLVGIVTGISLAWLFAITVFGLVGIALRALAGSIVRGVAAVVNYISVWLTSVADNIRQVTSSTIRAAGFVLSYIWREITVAVDSLWQAVVKVGIELKVVAMIIVGLALIGLGNLLILITTGLGYLGSGIAALVSTVILGATLIAGAGAAAVLGSVTFVVTIIGTGVSWVVSYLWRSLAPIAVNVAREISVGLGALWTGFTKTLREIWLALALGYRVLAFVSRKTAVIPLGIFSYLLWLASIPIQGTRMIVLLFRSILSGAFTAAFDICRIIAWVVRNRRLGIPISGINPIRGRLVSLAGTGTSFVFASFFLLQLIFPNPEPTVVVTHWSNTHLMRDGLLPEMADRFNQAEHRTVSGLKIQVDVLSTGSGEGARDLISRVTDQGPLQPELADPIIFTPHVDHWLVSVNHQAGRDVVDLDAAESIARSYIGIVTYKDMAECLGWPEKEIGYADIIALRADPDGWASYDCAKAEWGKRPLVAFTDPTTSSTGRTVLFTLYSIAAGKPPEQLTTEDIDDPAVAEYVKRFQGLIDHYMFTSIVLNTKIYQGPRYGHFFLMAEDNLIHLYEGTVSAIDTKGKKVTAPPIDRPMVMVYPKEGATASTHCACMIQAAWVSGDQAEAAQKWVAFLREDAQQRSFMAAGFRPGGDLPLTDASSKIKKEFGLNPATPATVLNPSLIGPDTAAAIDRSWVDIKRPGIVTFVVDTSGSMLGGKLRQAKDGLIRAVDAMDQKNQVGFISFDDEVSDTVLVRPLGENRTIIEQAVSRLKAGGETALYDAIKRGIEMTDAAEGDPEAIRGVVVLADGGANRGTEGLEGLIRMMSRFEMPIESCVDLGCSEATEIGGRVVSKTQIIGIGLSQKTTHPIQIFFIGIGQDADLEVGRMLAEATGAEFQGVTKEDLANVLEQFSKYF